MLGDSLVLENTLAGWGISILVAKANLSIINLKFLQNKRTKKTFNICYVFLMA